MTWTADPKKHEAMNEHGYKIVWADNKRGTWYNAYAPSGAHVDSGYDKEIVKAMCEKHRDGVMKKRSMRAAEKAAKELA